MMQLLCLTPTYLQVLVGCDPVPPHSQHADNVVFVWKELCLLRLVRFLKSHSTRVKKKEDEHTSISVKSRSERKMFLPPESTIISTPSPPVSSKTTDSRSDEPLSTGITLASHRKEQQHDSMSQRSKHQICQHTLIQVVVFAVYNGGNRF